MGPHMDRQKIRNIIASKKKIVMYAPKVGMLCELLPSDNDTALSIVITSFEISADVLNVFK